MMLKFLYTTCIYSTVWAGSVVVHYMVQSYAVPEAGHVKEVITLSISHCNRNTSAALAGVTHLHIVRTSMRCTDDIHTLYTHTRYVLYPPDTHTCNEGD